MVYTGIRVKNMEESVKFYTETLGMQLVERKQTPQTHGEVAMLKSQGSGQVIELNWYAHGSTFGVSYESGSEIDHLGFEVDDLESWIPELEAKGVKILVRPYEIGGWNEAFIEDPNGIWIEFLQSD